MEQTLTKGSVWKSLVRFSLPFFLSYFLQTLYGMADLYIIGRYNAVDSTTAVSIGSQVMHMITVVIVGLSMGGTVLIGQAIGARNKKEASLAVGNTATLFMAISLVITVVLLICVRPIVSAMSTPAEAVEGTIKYLTICFIGIPFITAYNIISSIFRGLGDSKSPMYFIAIACVFNIALDFLFIGALGMSAMGAALGTTLAQTVSVIVSLSVVYRRKSISVTKRDFVPSRSMMGKLLKIGLPIAAQDGFIQISFLVITVIANMRGLDDAAAVGVVEKLIGILFLIPSSMLQSVSALAAQNVGAGEHERARKILRYAVAICVGWGVLAVIVMQLRAEPFIGLFVKDKTVIAMGAQYMHGYVFDCIFAGIHFCFSGFFCAYGRSGYSFIHNSISIVCARIPLSYLASVRYPTTLLPMGFATVTGSVLSVIICLVLYSLMRKKLKAEELKV